MTAIEPCRVAAVHRVIARWRNGALDSVTVTLAEGWVVAQTRRDTLRLMRGAELNAEYLLEPGADAAWMKGWQSPVSAPLAVRLRIRRGDDAGVVDTLLFAIGPRG